MQHPGESLRGLFYSFTCQYQGDALTSEAYSYEARNIGLFQDTTELILHCIAQSEFSSKEKEEFFDSIQKHHNVTEPIRELASKYREKFLVTRR